VKSYLDVQDALLGDARGVLVLLVPPHRKPEAERLLKGVWRVRDHTDSPRAAVVGAVMTWDDWLDVWDDATRALPEHDVAAVAADLAQLREMFATLAGLDIRPLGEAAEGIGWATRRADLHRLVEQVTAEFRDPSSNILPTGTEQRFDFYRRYIAAWPDAWCALGVAGVFADAGNTPFWVRYHKKTPSFPAMRDRLMASGFAARARSDEGHVWLPLEVSGDVSGTIVVAELAEQVRKIHVTATGTV